MTRVNLISLLLVVLFALFFLWYTPLGGPLEQAEIEHYLSLSEERGTEVAERQRLRRFLEQDTGDDFVMVNVIELKDAPDQIEGVEPSDSASDVLDKYMHYMWPALLRRASHPVLGGTAAAGALDVFGIEGARTWTTGAAMRYRSRRDMMEIATNPEFRARHQFKLAAIEKTVAFPIDPWFQLGDPRLVFGLGVLAALFGLRLLPRRHRRSSLSLSGHLR